MLLKIIGEIIVWHNCILGFFLRLRQPKPDHGFAHDGTAKRAIDASGRSMLGFMRLIFCLMAAMGMNHPGHGHFRANYSWRPSIK